MQIQDTCNAKNIFFLLMQAPNWGSFMANIEKGDFRRP